MDNFLNNLKNEYREFINEAAAAAPASARRYDPNKPLDVSDATITSTTTSAPRTATAAGATTGTAQKIGQKAGEFSRHTAADLKNPWSRGFGALSGYDEWTRRRDQPLWKKAAGAALVGGTEMVSSALGTAAGAMTPVPGGAFVGGTAAGYGGYKAGQAAADYLLGSPGEDAEGDVSKALGKAFGAAGKVVGKGIKQGTPAMTGYSPGDPRLMEQETGYEMTRRIAQSQQQAKKEPSFNQAFHAARRAEKQAGRDPSQGTFTWKGKEYTTRLRDEPQAPKVDFAKAGQREADWEQQRGRMIQRAVRPQPVGMPEIDLERMPTAPGTMPTSGAAPVADEFAQERDKLLRRAGMID